jgi:UDP-N-acetylglucosamine 2-epimerase (non-hydrolysing)
MRIACIVGARPNFIKIAPIMMEFQKYRETFCPVLIHTGQHYDDKLSHVFFDQLRIPRPEYHLDVGPGTQAEQTAAIIERFDRLCATERFDRVLVVGDVTSTLACAIVAAKRSIHVDHVEAGLRSFDRTMPEEINRIVTDSLADLLFVTEPSASRGACRGEYPAGRERHDRQPLPVP